MRYDIFRLKFKSISIDGNKTKLILEDGEVLEVPSEAISSVDLKRNVAVLEGKTIVVSRTILGHEEKWFIVYPPAIYSEEHIKEKFKEASELFDIIFTPRVASRLVIQNMMKMAIYKKIKHCIVYLGY